MGLLGERTRDSKKRKKKQRGVHTKHLQGDLPLLQVRLERSFQVEGYRQEGRAGQLQNTKASEGMKRTKRKVSVRL